METTAGAGYAVIVTEAPVTVKAKKTDGTTVDIKVLDSTGQHTFIAMSGETLFEGGSVELGLVQGPFDPARALGGDNGGAGNISPEAKAFLEFVTDGKLTFTPDGRLKINASVDATGTFNHDGYASNYTKEVGGVKYTVTVSAAEITMRRAGETIPIMQLNKDGLELGGNRVLTEAYDLRRMEQQAYSNVTSYVDFNTLRYVVAGDSVEYIFPQMSATSGISTDNGVFVSPNGFPNVIAPGATSAKVVRVALAAWPSSNSHEFVPYGVGCTFDFFGTAVRIQYRSRAHIDMKANEVRITDFGTQVVSLGADFVGSNVPENIIYDIPIVAYYPLATSVGANSFFYRYLSSGVSRGGNRVANLKVSLPSMKSSFGFFAPTWDADGSVMRVGVKVHKQVLIDMLGSLPSPNAGATITACCDGADAHIGDDGTLVFDDAALATAVEAAETKGWTLNITPVNA